MANKPSFVRKTTIGSSDLVAKDVESQFLTHGRSTRSADCGIASVLCATIATSHLPLQVQKVPSIRSSNTMAGYIVKRIILSYSLQSKQSCKEIIIDLISRLTIELTRPRCAGCGFGIAGRSLNALGKNWHVECFTCQQCGCLLFGAGASDPGKFYEHEGLPYCCADYDLLFGGGVGEQKRAAKQLDTKKALSMLSDAEAKKVDSSNIGSCIS